MNLKRSKGEDRGKSGLENKKMRQDKDGFFEKKKRGYERMNEFSEETDFMKIERKEIRTDLKRSTRAELRTDLKRSTRAELRTD